MLRGLLASFSAILLTVSVYSERPTGIYASVDSLFAGRQIDAVEGLWQWPDDGATMLIVKQTATTYDIIALSPSRFDVAAGTVLGKAVATPTPGVFDARIYDSGSGAEKGTCTITVTPHGTLSFNAYRRGKTVDLWRLLPYRFRHLVKSVDNRPSNLDGPKRIYPLVPPSYKPVL